MKNRCPLFRGASAWLFVWALGLPLLGTWLVPSNAHAQLTKIFVASFGSDANDGSRGAPKRTFQAAHDAVAAGGEVVALDTAGYGALSITKSVGVTVPAGITGFITLTSGAAIKVNTAAATDTVTLRGLSINAVNKSGAPRGILVSNADTVSVSDCTISGYTNGIDFSPSAAATLLVTGSALRANSSNGIVVASFASGNVQLVVTDCELSFSQGAVTVVGSNTSGVTHRVVLSNTAVVGNTGQAIAISGPTDVVLQNCTLSANAEAIRVSNLATIRVDGCAVTGNITGLFNNLGGNLLSRGNNTVEDNTTNGAFTGTYAAK